MYIPKKYRNKLQLDVIKKASHTDEEKDMNGIEIKPNSVVRLVKNSVGASKEDGNYLVPWDVIRVISLDQRNGANGDPYAAVIFNNGRTTQFIPVEDVELVERCICAKAIRAIGCRCGFQQVQDGKV